MKLDTSRKRFEYIETKLFWEDGLTAGELGQTFGLTRQAAQTVIDNYRRDYPDQMKYDPSRKRHIASESFTPKFIRKDSILFLDYLRGESLAGYYREEAGWTDLMLTDVDSLLRPKLPLEPVKTVLSALLSKKVVTIDYRQKDLKPDEISVRSISPNHLIFADNRYHLRAYCHTKDAYLDFVLSRIVYAEMSKQDWVSSGYDEDWKNSVILRFKPNPELSQSVRNAILRNYETSDGLRLVKSRKALVLYIERELCRPDFKYKKPLWERVIE